MAPAVLAGPRRRSLRLSLSQWPVATASASFLDLDAASSPRTPVGKLGVVAADGPAFHWSSFGADSRELHA
jgi:hypothetical protein